MRSGTPAMPLPDSASTFVTFTDPGAFFAVPLALAVSSCSPPVETTRWVSAVTGSCTYGRGAGADSDAVTDGSSAVGVTAKVAVPSLPVVTDARSSPTSAPSADSEIGTFGTPLPAAFVTDTV